MTYCADRVPTDNVNRGALTATFCPRCKRAGWARGLDPRAVCQACRR